MTVTVNQMMKVLRLASEAEIPRKYLPYLEKPSSRIRKLGLMLVCDAFEGAIARSAKWVENELFCQNPYGDNLGAFLWWRGYKIITVTQGFRHAWFKIRIPEKKKAFGKYKSMTNAGIALLRIYVKKGGFDREKKTGRNMES